MFRDNFTDSTAQFFSDASDPVLKVSGLSGSVPLSWSGWWNTCRLSQMAQLVWGWLHLRTYWRGCCRCKPPYWSHTGATERTVLLRMWVQWLNLTSRRRCSPGWLGRWWSGWSWPDGRTPKLWHWCCRTSTWFELVLQSQTEGTPEEITTSENLRSHILKTETSVCRRPHLPQLAGPGPGVSPPSQKVWRVLAARSGSCNLVWSPQCSPPSFPKEEDIGSLRC